MGREFEIYQKRLATRGASEVERMTKEKLNSFLSVLAKSYNAEDLDKGGSLNKGLISDNRQNMESDEKVVSIPFEAGYKVGDLIHWIRTDTRWLIITHELTERAYFRGHIKKALYSFRWRNKQGVICETWAAIKGPSGGDKEETGSAAIVETPGATMTLWFGAVDGYDALAEIDAIMVANKVWRIVSVDDITTPGLVEMDLILDIPDEDQDNTEEQIARDYEHLSAIAPSAEIFGADTINPLDGLRQIYTTTLTGGVWNIDPTFATITSSTDDTVGLAFTEKIGTVDLTYSIGGIVVATKTIKVTSIFG